MIFSYLIDGQSFCTDINDLIGLFLGQGLTLQECGILYSSEYGQDTVPVGMLES